MSARSRCQPRSLQPDSNMSLILQSWVLSWSILGAKDREGLMQVERDLLTLQRVDLKPFC